MSEPARPPAKVSLRIELGRSTLPASEAESLGIGSQVTLDAEAGQPVDIVVNGQLMARGEVLVVEGQFWIRVIERVAQSRAA
jgi:flagellar motor switch protein FliN/FliY